MFSVTASLQIDYTAKTIKVVDSTDYSALDLNNITVWGRGSINAPDGSVVVSSNFLVDISGGATDSAA